MRPYKAIIPAPGWEDTPRKFPYGDAWMSENEAELLGKYAAKRDYLEIGTYHGYSAYVAVQKAKSVTCIDRTRPDNLVRFLADHPHVRFILGNSLNPQVIDQIKPRSVDMILFDGNHTYDAVKYELINYLPKLRVGGVLAFHDYNTQGTIFGKWEVARAVEENLHLDDYEIEYVDSLVILQEK